MSAAQKQETAQKVEAVERPRPTRTVRDSEKPVEPEQQTSGSGERGINILSPMSGTILDVLVSVGDSVSPVRKL